MYTTQEEPAGPVEAPEQLPPVPVQPGPVQPGPGAAGGPDGRDVETQFAGDLGYLSKLAQDLGVPDPVEEYFAPVVGRWSDMHAEAERWRLVGDAAGEVTGALNQPLGKLDAAWDGEAATSFIDYMQKIGLAGQDLSDAMVALADVLDTTANGIREIVQQMAGVLSETARSASGAMTMPVQGDERTRQFLDMMRRPTKELFESVRQLLEAFVQMCEGIDGSDAFGQVTMAHTFPEENWSFEQPKVPETKIPGEGKTDAAEASAAGGGGGGLGGFGGGAGGGGGLGGAAAAMGPGGYAVATEQAPSPKPAATGAAAAAASSGGGAGMGRGMGGMMPMAPMMGGMGQGGGGEHKSRSRLVGDPADIFGKPEKASSPVIGDDD